MILKIRNSLFKTYLSHRINEKTKHYQTDIISLPLTFRDIKKLVRVSFSSLCHSLHEKRTIDLSLSQNPPSESYYYSVQYHHEDFISIPRPPLRGCRL